MDSILCGPDVMDEYVDPSSQELNLKQQSKIPIEVVMTSSYTSQEVPGIGQRVNKKKDSLGGENEAFPRRFLKLGGACLSKQSYFYRILAIGGLGQGFSQFLPPHSTINQFATTIVIYSLIPTVRAEDDGDNFANNLFSDLAPILALFGEQVTKQFLSESSGWADNILFAMAPLGVITGIVSAIRVAGPTWLRALVGRGKEGLAQTELELMSSNSPDVGEMWNGQAIVRVLGTPSIFQVIYAQDAVKPHDEGADLKTTIGVLNDENHFFERREVKRPPARSIPRGAWSENPDIEMRPLLPDQTDQITLNQVDDSKSPPNISLNARGEPIGNIEKWIMASIGVVSQCVVIIYHSLISYYPPWTMSFLKDGNPPAMEAFPCTVIGTVFLNLGMLICSYVIDCASVEERWVLKDGLDQDSQNCKVAWVQKGGTVNDQIFAPYIIFGHKGQREITMSHRCHRGRELQLRIWVLLGTFSSLAGFVTQFVGLRGMHWSASIAQLAAIAFVTAIRAFARRRMTKEPIASRAVEGFELDCMAREMKDCFALKVITDIPTDTPPARRDSLSHDIVLIRKHLSDLSGWPTEVEHVTHTVCSAIERTINYIYQDKDIHLFDGAERLTEISWKLPTLTLENGGSSGTRAIYHYGDLELKVTSIRGEWGLSEDMKAEIAAILSLWRLYFAEEESYCRMGYILPEKKDLDDIHQIAKVLPWPRHKAHQQLFNLWMGNHDLDMHIEKPEIIASDKQIPNHRFFGNLKVSQDSDLNGTNVVIFPEASVKQTFAQEVFSAFFSAIVPHIDYISGKTVITSEKHGMNELHHSVLSHLVDIVSETGIGCRQEILMGIITNLGKRQLLPSVDNEVSDTIRHVHIERSIRRSRLENQWDVCAAQVKEMITIARKEEAPSWIDNWTAQRAVERFYIRVIGLSKGTDAESHDPGHPRSQFRLWIKNIDLNSLGTTPADHGTGSGIHDYNPPVNEDAMKIRLLLEPFHTMNLFQERGGFRSGGTFIQSERQTRQLELLEKTMGADRRILAHALSEAVKEGFDTVMEALIDFNQSTYDESDKSPESPLMVALSRGHASIVQQILNQMYLYQPDPYHQFQAKDQQIFVWDALRRPDETTARILLGHTSSLHRAIYSPASLILAAGYGHYDIFNELLLSGADVDARVVGNYNQMWLLANSKDLGGLTRVSWHTPNTSLVEGYERRLYNTSLPWEKGDYWSVITYHLQRGDVRAAAGAISVRTALQLAAEEGREVMVTHLLKAGATVNMKPRGRSWRSALQAAAGRNHLNIVNILLEKKAYVNERAWGVSGRTALQAAAEGGHLGIVDRLLEVEADVNAKQVELYGLTALQAAASGGYLEVVSRLLENGADINAKPANHHGRTALQAASAGGYLDLVALLLKNKAVINAKPSKSHGLTALQAAALGGHIDVLNYLLKHGAEVNDTPSNSHGLTSLQAAAAGGHLKVAKLLISAGADASAKPVFPRSRTALQAAAEGGHLEMVNLLLPMINSVNEVIAPHAGRTALQAASEMGHLSVVNKLLEVGADINHKPAEPCGKTALQAACTGGHREVVKLLLKSGANVNALPSKTAGETALQAAAHGGHLGLVIELLEQGADVDFDPADSYGLTALQAAAIGGHLDVVEHLLQLTKGTEEVIASHGGRTAVQGAAEMGHLAIVNKLLAKGFDVNALPAESYGRTALQAASAWGHMDLVNRLLESGANINAEPSKTSGRTALQAAAEGGFLDIVDRLIYGNADINVGGSNLTALQAAAEGGYLQVVERLLDNNAEVNAEGAILTALQAAAKGGHLKVVNRLLESGAHVNAKPMHSWGATALQGACREGHLDVVGRLLEADADVNADGMFTAIEAAARGGYLDVVKLLLQSDANPNMGGTEITALQAASKEGYHKIVDVLLKGGADINAKPSKEKGVTALQAAIKGGHTTAVVMLQKAGAK